MFRTGAARVRRVLWDGVAQRAGVAAATGEQVTRAADAARGDPAGGSGRITAEGAGGDGQGGGRGGVVLASAWGEGSGDRGEGG